MGKSKKRRKILTFIIIFVLFSLIITRYTNISHIDKSFVSENCEKDELQIHVIDVGQAESILIIQNNTTMLVDTGSNSSGDDIVEYIRGLGIDYIDILMITHFHQDHAGGAHSIISSLDVRKILCTKYSDLISLQERFWYLDMSIARSIKETFNSTSILMESAYYNGKLREFNIGDTKIQILNQDNNTDIVNNKSIVFKLVYGDFSMLFMADAEAEVEEKLLEKNIDVSADILKIGHHGSRTSTTEEFLNEVDPKYSVVSCGSGNEYNHPYRAVTKLFEERDIPLYRTDELGNIVITVKDGSITFDKEKGNYLSGRELRESS